MLDCTYGLGKFWSDVQPLHFYHTDLIDDDPVDFTDQPWVDGCFDVVVFDPPYVSIGGRTTTTLPQFHERYGMNRSKLSPTENAYLIYQGMVECHRVLKKNGLLWVKSMNYISGGKFITGHHNVFDVAMNMLCMEQIDEFVHVSGLGPQPKHNLDGSVRQQVHARNGHSFLDIYKKKS